MTGVTFEFNVAQLFSPVLLLVVAWLIKVARDQITDNMNAKHTENSARLERIEAQTTLTNGKVAAHETAITALQAKTELLTEIYLKSQPDKGA